MNSRDLICVIEKPIITFETARGDCLFVKRDNTDSYFLFGFTILLMFIRL